MDLAVFRATSAKTFLAATSKPGVSKASAEILFPIKSEGIINAPAPNPAV
jgi:hypothetical protein